MRSATRTHAGALLLELVDRPAALTPPPHPPPRHFSALRERPVTGNFRGDPERQKLADDRLWGLTPQSSPRPIRIVLPSSAYGEHREPQLPATRRHPGDVVAPAARAHMSDDFGPTPRPAIVTGTRSM